MTENLDAYLQDFGVPVVAGAVSGLGIFDNEDQELGGIAISSGSQVLLKVSDFGGLKNQDSISVNGVNYKVKEFKVLADGAFGRAFLTAV